MKKKELRARVRELEMEVERLRMLLYVPPKPSESTTGSVSFPNNVTVMYVEEDREMTPEEFTELLEEMMEKYKELWEALAKM
jgi:hypothetical protein